MTKIFFTYNVECSSKNFRKIMSADVKANIKKQQEIKDLVVYLAKKFLQNLKYNIKRGYLDVFFICF